MDTKSSTKLQTFVMFGIAMLIGYLLFKSPSLDGGNAFSQVAESANLWAIFITGLTVGGLTCLAVQGGLLASTITARNEGDLDQGSTKQHNLFPVAAFLVAKFISYTTLGFVLGMLGQTLAISDSLRTIMQIVVGLYMVAVALNLLNVHPIFRYAVIQPPHFLMKMVKNQSKSKDIFAPALLGFMTVFIPCGTTLAMEALAISSGDPLYGAGIMAAFTLGTVPLFFGIGYLTNLLGDTFKRNFYKVAAFLLIYLGVTTLNAGLVLAGSPITLQSLSSISPIQINLSGETTSATQETGTLVAGTQVFNINVLPTGYSPRVVTAKAGTPVRLNLITDRNSGCTLVFKIPTLGISKILKSSGTDYVDFIPQQKGTVVWTCGMGMYLGGVEVI